MSRLLWHNAVTNPPPVLKDVLLAVIGEEAASEGWRNPKKTGGYTYSSGHAVAGNKVFAWTELPTCPVIIPEPMPLKKGRAK